jgi:hypothetical protein
MALESRVRFSVDLDRETDAEVKKLAQLERRSKRNFHAVLLWRLVREWRKNPDRLRDLKLIQPEAMDGQLL